MCLHPALVQVLIISSFNYCHYITLVLPPLLLLFLLIGHIHLCHVKLRKYRSKTVDSTEVRMCGAAGVNGYSPSGVLWPCLSRYKHRCPLTQSSTSRNLPCRCSCMCKDVCVCKGINYALFIMTRYWKAAEQPW